MYIHIVCVVRCVGYGGPVGILENDYV